MGFGRCIVTLTIAVVALASAQAHCRLHRDIDRLHHDIYDYHRPIDTCTEVLTVAHACLVLSYRT